jgi:NTE family protein
MTLGADRVIVVGLNSSLTPAKALVRPDAIDGVAQLLQVILADQLAEDVATLAAVNEALAPAEPAADAAPARRSRGAPAHRGRRTIRYIFIAPSDRLAIGRLARNVYRRHYAGIRGFARDTDLALLGRLVRAERSDVHGELLSYLFLARRFIDELIALGRRDAERWLQTRHDAGLWQIGRMPSGEPAAPASRRRRARSRT